MKLNTDDKKRLVLPYCVTAAVPDAEADDLRVLLYIAACEADGKEFEVSSAAEILGISESEVRSSVKFWRGAGAICKSAKAKPGKAETQQADGEESVKKKPLRDKSPARYSADDLSRIADSNREFRVLIDMAQQTAGWIFNTHDIEVIASLYSNLRLSPEYILALINYYICRKEKSLHYLEKVAYDFVDNGIDTAEALEERLQYLEKYEAGEGKIRRIFGLGGRKLTAKESELIHEWFDVYKFGDDIISLAYEKTVNSTGKASINYAASILRSWHENGVKTVEEASRGQKQKSAKTVSQSFDVDEAFEKALRRSYKSGGDEKK